MTTKGRFAVTAMLDLAMARRQGSDNARRNQPAAEHLASYLEQLFGKLRRHNWSTASRPGGGYTLARSLERVSVADIMPRWTSRSMRRSAAARKCHDEQRCMTHDLWAGKLNDKMYDTSIR